MSDNLSPETVLVPRRSPWKRWVVLVAVVLAAILLIQQRSSLTTDSLIRQEAEYRQLYADHPLFVLGAAFLVYVGMTALSIPGASILTLASGWLFGFWPALLMVSFASSTGATLSCGLSRTLFREAVRYRLGTHLKMIEQSLARDGDFYLLTLRLLPQVPFFIINLAMGLTNYPLWRFYAVSQIGMFPATCVFVYAGAQAVDLRTLFAIGPSSLFTPNMIIALSLLAILPWGLRSLVHMIRPESPPLATKTSPDAADQPVDPPPSSVAPVGLPTRNPDA